MAVTVSANSTRSDYMISDAAIPQAVEEQSEKFRELLTELDSKSQKFADIKEAYDSGKYDVPDAEELQGEISAGTDILSKSDMRKLAKLIASGKVNVKDIPKDFLTPELMAQVILLKQTDSAAENEESEEESDSLFSGEADTAVQSLAAQSVNADSIVNISEEFASISESVRQEAADTVLAVEMSAENEPVLKQVLADTEIPRNTEASAAENIPQEISENTLRNFTGNAVESDTVSAGEKTAVTEETAAVLEQAAAKGEISKPEVRQADKPLETTEQEIPVTAVRDKARSDKAVNEELEMLRSAKTVKAQDTEKPMRDASVPTVIPQENTRSVLLTGKDGGTVEVKPSDVAEQVLKSLQTAIKENREQTEYSMVLNPEELGRITVRLTKAADGAVSVTISAENARTQRILEQHSELMQSNLKDSGVKLESWQTVSESQQEAHAEDYRGSAKNPYFARQNERRDDDEDEQSFAEIIAAM